MKEEAAKKILFQFLPFDGKMKNEFGNAIQFVTLLLIVDFLKLTIIRSRENASLVVASDFVGSYIALL